MFVTEIANHFFQFVCELRTADKSVFFFFILKVSGETFERELSGKQSAYYSILFYASWCPFSSNTRPMFDALSSMFPQIKHLLVEESSVMPRYAVPNYTGSFALLRYASMLYGHFYFI